MPPTQASRKRLVDTPNAKRKPFRPAPKPRDWTPSSFVTACLECIPQKSHKFAVDLGCGYGRHARLLASAGYRVFALDLHRQALQALPRRLSARKRGQSCWGSIHPIEADVTAALPLRGGSLNLVLAVHCSIHDNLPAIEATLAPGGFLIYETFGDRGMNWVELPTAGELSLKLRRRFEILILEEQPAGPARKRAVMVRLLARKRT